MPELTTTDNQAIYFEDHGSGRPVVLIHGWPLSGRAWEPQLAPLVDGGHRVITYDRRGFGASSQPWGGYDYDTLAGDLNQLLAALDVHDATLVGFSMGGGEVARYLGRYGGERIHSAVFVSAVPPYLYKSDDNPDGGLDDATIEQFQQGVVGDRIAFVEGFVDAFLAAGERHDLVSDAQKRYLVQIASFASAKGTLDCINAFSRTDFRGDLAKIKVPTLVVHGDSDAIVPFEVSGKRTHETISSSQLVIIEGGPHGLNATHASQFNAALLEFLAK
jgi:pimeloyl-ACP methyl ester carboxylesterase